VALIFETIHTEGVAALSYLVGDESAGVAAVIDPRVDVDIYLELARHKKLAITHIFETHNHADFVSGARELHYRLPTARIFLSDAGGTAYGFDYESLEDGRTFEFGSLHIRARHTPGHTPEHVAFLLAGKERPDSPWGVLSGDSLFVNSVGRPDLMGEAHTDSLIEQLYQTLTGFYLDLDDSVIIFPGHGAGSACGADIGERPFSTIGHERAFNPFLQFDDRDDFAGYVRTSAPPEPTHYRRLKKLNAQGPEPLGHLPTIPAHTPAAFQKAIEAQNAVLVDTRHMLAFGGGHIEQAINIGARPLLSVWAGWLLDPEQPILLVLEHDDDLEEVVTLFWRTGYTRFAGYLAGGMTAWANSGLEMGTLPQMTVHELETAADEVQILDVRSPQEWQEDHIPGAMHIALPDLEQKQGELDRERPLAVYCGSGYRANIGASLLKRHGFERVHNVPGSWQAWQELTVNSQQSTVNG
jgi:hydroxyacylglutathione hydrolase